MSFFYFEDIVALRADSSIVGTIEHTWSDIEDDIDVSQDLDICHVHTLFPPNVIKAWYGKKRLSPGYVIINFMNQPGDGYCLVHESSLVLIDRGLAAGDCVKKSHSEAQSGIVLSTSLMCTLQPLCSEAAYNRNPFPKAQDYRASWGPHTPTSKPRGKSFLHDLPKSAGSSTLNSISPLNTSSMPLSFEVPAQELTYWHTFREEDFVIFNDWIGQVTCVYDEVTVRLSDGSVVILEEPEELEEPYLIPGSTSHELRQRLDRAGFYMWYPGMNAPSAEVPDNIPAEPCYPGQYVRTKKGNLCCGRWKSGAYDPAVSPMGIVVDVRCVQLEVRWLHPNQLKPLQDRSDPPAGLLEVDELESEGIMVYDRNRLPKHPASGLAMASYSRDTGFGHRMRFRDPASAEVKYGHVSIHPRTGGPVSHFRRIPRSATQGFDMNVLQVISTTTTALVRWQDCTVTEEKSTDLFPYLNPDDHDVWPGDKVSYIPDEVPSNDLSTGSSTETISLQKVGVVQHVDAVERIASVRWFKDPKIKIDGEKIWQVSGMKYGEISSETAQVSLYEIAAHDALRVNRADGVMILPEPATSTSENIGNARLLAAGAQTARGILESAVVALGGVPSSTAQSRDGISPTETAADKNDWRNVEWCGEVVDLGLDGQIQVRLGAALHVRDINIPPERALVFETTDDDSDYTDEDGDESDETEGLSVADSDPDSNVDAMSVEALDVFMEYEDGTNLDGVDDDRIWTADEEDETDSNKVAPDNETSEARGEIPSLIQGRTQANILLRGNLRASDGAVSFSSYPSMFEQFAVLEGVPNDHHFTNTTEALTAQIMRRITKEKEILCRSLPGGVFVRTWEARWDLLRIVIIGPYDTPYEFAPFVFDLQFDENFPTSPPNIFFHSWTNNLGRINPNLYEDGMICLSLLGTWDADERNAAWCPKTSTVLQIIVSFMGLVLNKEPYFSKSFRPSRVSA